MALQLIVNQQNTSYILIKRLLELTCTKYNEYKSRSMIFKICRRKYNIADMNTKQSWHNHESKTSLQTHLGVADVLLITYIYIERVSLDTQWMAWTIKGFAWMIAEVLSKQNMCKLYKIRGWTVFIYQVFQTSRVLSSLMKYQTNTLRTNKPTR